MSDPLATLGSICEKLGLDRSDSLQRVSWNGNALEEVYPWGTIRKATPEANKATARVNGLRTTIPAPSPRT